MRWLIFALVVIWSCFEPPIFAIPVILLASLCLGISYAESSRF